MKSSHDLSRFEVSFGGNRVDEVLERSLHEVDRAVMLGIFWLM